MRLPASDARDARHALITAANRLLFSGLPLRQPESRIELAAFVKAASVIPLPAADRQAVLVATLSVLNPHAGGRLPGLVDRYLAKSTGRLGRLDVFAECVEELMRYRGIGHPAIQQAIAIIHSDFGTPALTPASMAAAVGLTPTALADKFRRYTSLSPCEFLRDVRLDRAAAQLMSTKSRLKEIWVSVGYNDAANFDHDFKAKFNMSPRAFRAIGIENRPSGLIPHPFQGESPSSSSKNAVTVLIVDDDAVLCDTCRRLFTRAGFNVMTASDGRTGLARASASAVDVVLLDYRLPDFDGLEFLRVLRERRPGHKPAVALFTADWAVEDREAEVAGLSAGIVSKLCDFDELERLVRSYCDMPLT